MIQMLKSALYDYVFPDFVFARCKILVRQEYSNGQLLWKCRCLLSETETYLPECSFELHNHSSGVTCEWFSWPEDQSGAAYLREHLSFRTKASAVRPTLRVADLQRPGRLRRKTHPASTNTLQQLQTTALSSELHYLTWKTEIHLSFEPDVLFDEMHWPIWVQYSFGS